MKEIKDLITTSEFRREAGVAGIATAETSDATVNVAGVNVWKDPEDRYPATTVWWPKEVSQVFCWGDNFEHEAPSDTDAVTLVEKVKATL